MKYRGMDWRRERDWLGQVRARAEREVVGMREVGWAARRVGGRCWAVAAAGK